MKAENKSGKNGAQRASEAASGVSRGRADSHSAPQQDLSGAVRAASSLEIVTVRFTGFTALTSYGAFDTLPSNVTAKIAFTRPKVKSVGSRVAISSTLLFRVLPLDGPPALDLRATAELVYVRKPDAKIADADIEQFAVINAPFNAWAYWREFVQSSLARLNLPTFAMPLFRISDATKLMITDEES